MSTDLELVPQNKLMVIETSRNSVRILGKKNVS